MSQALGVQLFCSGGVLAHPQPIGEQGSEHEAALSIPPVDDWTRVFDGVFFIDTMTPVHQR